MASAFTLTDLSLHYSEKHLLEHVTLTVSEGDKIGIVGRNGAGKSTLLRLLAGTEEPDRGEVSRKRGLTVVMISHDVDAALSYADRILHMAHGVTFLGTPEAYRQSPLGMAFAGGETHA